MPPFVFAVLFIPSFNGLSSFLCLQWVLFLFDAGCSDVGIRDKRILCLLHKILQLVLTVAYGGGDFSIKMRSLFQI